MELLNMIDLMDVDNLTTMLRDTDTSHCCRASGQHKTRTVDQDILFSHVLLLTDAIFIIYSCIFRWIFLNPDIFIWDHTLQMLLSTRHLFSVQDITQHDEEGCLSVQGKAAQNISAQIVCLYGSSATFGKFSVLLWSPWIFLSSFYRWNDLWKIDTKWHNAVQGPRNT